MYPAAAAVASQQQQQPAENSSLGASSTSQTDEGVPQQKEAQHNQEDITKAEAMGESRVWTPAPDMAPLPSLEGRGWTFWI